MHSQDNINDLDIQETVGDGLTVVDENSPRETRLKVEVEPDLILQDVSEEDFKQAVRNTVVIVKQDAHDDVQSDDDRSDCIDMFYNMNHRECPLTVPANMNGLVGDRTFWHEPIPRMGLYDCFQPETKEESLVPVAFPAKQLNVNRVPHTPSNGPAPISIMAQYLYNQMEELANMKAEIDRAEATTDTGDCEREMRDKNVHKGKKVAWNVPNEGIDTRGSRVMRWFRRLCCCARKNDGE